MDARVEHIVYVKKMKIKGLIINHGFIKIEDAENFQVVNEILYFGKIVYPIDYSGRECNFFNSMIVKDFGNITIDEILEKYPEYLI